MKSNIFSNAAINGRHLSLILFCLLLPSIASQAQNTPGAGKATPVEDYGNTLNIGLGAGYYSYLQNHSAPFIFANYEFDISRGFTLAPFLGYSSSAGSGLYKYNGYFNYRETVELAGIKGAYYFDELLALNRKWDLYAALSLGLVYDKVTLDQGPNGLSGGGSETGHFDAELHIGGEYHFNYRLGLWLDLSTGVSSLGIAIHHL